MQGEVSLSSRDSEIEKHKLRTEIFVATLIYLIFFQVDKDTIKVEKWFGKSKQIAAVRTVCSHIENLFKGVMKVNYTFDDT